MVVTIENLVFTNRFLFFNRCLFHNFQGKKIPSLLEIRLIFKTIENTTRELRTIGLEGKRERTPPSSIKRSKYKDFLSFFEAVERGEITVADCEEEVREATDGYAAGLRVEISAGIRNLESRTRGFPSCVTEGITGERLAGLHATVRVSRVVKIRKIIILSSPRIYTAASQVARNEEHTRLPRY